MYLITSAAYVAPELQSEFGLLPPCFLPVGNKRLFHHQLALLPKSERRILTLPEGFSPGPYDAKTLADEQVELLFLPKDLSLGESIVYALNLIEFDPKEPLFILHGDTLFDALPTDADVLGLSKVVDNYDWAEYDEQIALLRQHQANQVSSNDLIANGFFSFSSPKTLLRHIVQAKWNFIKGVNGYIQEKGLTPHIVKDWYDFGHCQTYYQSKTQITTQRAFNNMTITGQVVTKTSTKKTKLAAEANWYQTIPGALRVYTPQLLAAEESQNEFSYSVQYLHLTALNELYVFSQLPAFAWKKIFKACCQFLTQADSYKAASKYSLSDLFIEKTISRLAEYQAPFNLELPMQINGKSQPCVRDLLAISSDFLPQDTGAQNVIHGDFCFSNILYDFRTCSIKVIDPRGIDGQGNISIYGNQLYDIAKLSHSVIGLYDVIIAGYFFTKLEGQTLAFDVTVTERREQIMSEFVTLMKHHFDVTELQLYAMQIQLFISMLPLHNDRPDRQLGFIANAYRLYDKMQILLGKE